MYILTYNLNNLFKRLCHYCQFLLPIWCATQPYLNLSALKIITSNKMHKFIQNSFPWKNFGRSMSMEQQPTWRECGPRNRVNVLVLLLQNCNFYWFSQNTYSTMCKIFNIYLKIYFMHQHQIPFFTPKIWFSTK